MVCFRDMTFCSSDCINEACHRHYGDKISKAARVWWGKDDAPIAMSDYSGDCDDYVTPVGEQ